jgi:primosomal protein N'
LNFYYCDACHYCFESQSLPDRCPDCGAVMFGEKSAVRPATENEKTELLRIRAEDND